MILTENGVLKLMQRIKSFIASQLNTKAPSVHTHSISEIDDLSSLQMGGGYSKSEVDTLLNGKSDTSHTHTVSDVTDFPTLATVATSGSYNDLSNKPATMTPTSHTHGNITNDGKIGSNANKPLITTTNGVITTGSFGTTANTFCEGNDSRLSDARTPTAHTHSASDITSGLSTVATSGSYNDLTNKPTIPTVNNATLTIQKNGTTVKTFTANASSNVTANITVPTKTSDLTNDSGFLTSHQSLANYVTLNDAQTIPGNKTFSGLTKTTGKFPYSYSGNDLNNAIYNIETTYWSPDTANRPNSFYGTLLSLNREVNVHTSEGTGWIAQFGIGVDSVLYLRTKTNKGGDWSSWKQFITYDEAIPRSGGAVVTGTRISKTTNDSELSFDGGTGFENGATITLYGKNSSFGNGCCTIYANDGANPFKSMWLYGTGTWMWNGTAVQITSDQRFKQQITEIDDNLLDAWEDVNLVQFKYNDAVDQKKDKARLHTGYVVQQIDEACKSHGVDISEYGLYCHEEYAEETREVEQADGTKKTEIVRPASEHYSLRYTEALIVECAYLRRENARLKERLSKIEKLLNI